MDATLDEIKSAVFSMKGLKSPGPDGIQPIFFHIHWDTVKLTLLDFVNGALSSGKVKTEFLKAHMVLIPKGENP